MCVLWIGFSGIVAAAILVTVMTGKLTMTRRERLLHQVLKMDAIDASIKHKAAIVLQRTFRRYKTNKPVIRWPNMGAFSLIGGSGSGGPGSNSVKGPSSIFEVAQGVSSAATAILGIKPEHITMTNLSVEGSPSSGHLEELTSSLREDSVIPGKIKGIIPIVYDAKIVEAVTEFKKLRVRRKFMLRDQHDICLGWSK